MLIGSRAIAHWNCNFKVRELSDWDIIGNPKDEYLYRLKFNIPDGQKIEWHNPDFLNNRYMVDFYSNNDEVCIPIGLAIIYRSHLWRSYKFDSHVTKYHKFIVPMLDSTYDADILKGYNPVLVERTRLTKKEFPQGNPNLNQSNSDFFDDSVKKVYDHDFLHELYAYGGVPMYTKLKYSDKESSAWCEKELWDNLPLTYKLRCVAEETYVIATERYIIPNNYKYSYKRAYFQALEKVCTTLTSGWFRDFAIDRYPLIVDMFEQEKVSQVVEYLRDPNTDKVTYGEEK